LLKNTLIGLIAQSSRAKCISFSYSYQNSGYTLSMCMENIYGYFKGYESFLSYSMNCKLVCKWNRHVVDIGITDFVVVFFLLIWIQRHISSG